MFRHLLVPTDGSDLSKTAIEQAVRFASEIGARITFFIAKPDYPMAMYGEGALIDPVSPDKYAQAAQRQAEDILAQAQAASAAAGVHSERAAVTSDAPYQAIIDTAIERGCDLIFMASHGRRGLAGLLLGSETQKVLTHSSIPVLVYR